MPAFERSKWVRMRQFYHVSKSLREAARKAQLSKRWCHNLNHPVVPDSLFPAQFGGRGTYPALETGRNPPLSFHGTTTPEYLALDLYLHPYTARGQMVENMEHALGSFARFATDHPVFKTLRRIDVLVTICQHRRETATRHVKELVDCINSQWERQNVHDGIVRVW